MNNKLESQKNSKATKITPITLEQMSQIQGGGWSIYEKKLLNFGKLPRE